MSRMGILRELELAEGHKHYELNQPFPHHHHHLVCIQCNQTVEFKNDSILKQGMKQVEKEGLQLIDCQLTIHTICPEAVRMGWPAGCFVSPARPDTIAGHHEAIHFRV